MLDESVIAPVRQSFGRVIASNKLFDTFYKILVRRSPLIARKFSNTDFEKQYKLLEHSLAMSLLFPQKNVIAMQALSKIRETHSRDKLNIEPTLYNAWLESLIQAISQHDPEFNAELEQHWRKVLKTSLDYIASGY